MPYRPYPPPLPLEEFRDLIGELPPDHLARLVEQVVEEVLVSPPRPPQKGNTPYDPRVCLKVLVYGYATGTRSSRQLERLCRENLGYLFLTRGQAPCYHTLSTARLEEKERLEEVWVALFAVADALGMKRVGHVVVDSTKVRANASREAIVSQEEYAAVRAELVRILEVAQAVDEREDQEGYPGETRLKREVEGAQMREILREVRQRRAREKEAGAGGAGAPAAPESEEDGGTDGEGTGGEEGDARGAAAVAGAKSAPEAAGASSGEEERKVPLPMRLSRRMLGRVQKALVALAQGAAEGRKHVCLTDPEARMMPEGRERKVRECHSFEVAVDEGLLVVGQTSAAGNDNDRLTPILEAAQPYEPEGVKAATGDSGFFRGDDVGKWIRAGVDACIPDPNTAADLHRGQPIGTHRAKSQGKVELGYDATTDCWRCPMGNELIRLQDREQSGQVWRVYRAKESCRGCPLAAACLAQPRAKHRTVKVGRYHAELAAAEARFREAEHQARYRHRGEAVETVFGFVRGTLGYVRWLLRGQDGVAREGQLFKVAYQVRKIHRVWAIQQAGKGTATG